MAEIEVAIHAMDPMDHSYDRVMDISASTCTRFKWTDETTVELIHWRVSNEHLFTGRRNSACLGFLAYIREKNLEGKVDVSTVKRKWENLKEKYKKLKNQPNGITAEGGETSAATWRWFRVMDDVMEHRVFTSPSPKRAFKPRPPREADWVGLLHEMMRREDEREQRTVEREEQLERERREREEQLERERREREERLERERREREERLERERREREDRMAEEQRQREKEYRDREERRERQASVREERLMTILQALLERR